MLKRVIDFLNLISNLLPFMSNIIFSGKNKLPFYIAINQAVNVRNKVNYAFFSILIPKSMGSKRSARIQKCR